MSFSIFFYLTIYDIYFSFKIFDFLSLIISEAVSFYFFLYDFIAFSNNFY